MANGHGGRRPGAGRKRGGINKRPAKSRLVNEAAVAAAETGISPVEYMLAVMRDPNAEADRRDRMAAAVAPYVHPRLAQIEAKVDQFMEVAVISAEELRQQAAREIDAAFAPKVIEHVAGAVGGLSDHG